MLTFFIDISEDKQPLLEKSKIIAKEGEAGINAKVSMAKSLSFINTKLFQLKLNS